jgi:hypothetical protein
MRYWINVISSNHVKKGMEGGFTQYGHGKRTALETLSPGDIMVFYSARETVARNSPAVQRFTAHAKVKDSPVYQVEMSSTFKTWRKDMEFTPESKVKHADIRPLIGKLDFIKDKKHWGMAFRRGLFEISEKDYGVIAEKMFATQTGAQIKEAI